MKTKKSIPDFSLKKIEKENKSEKPEIFAASKEKELSKTDRRNFIKAGVIGTAGTIAVTSLNSCSKDKEKSEKNKECKMEISKAHISQIVSIAFSNDGKKIATSSYDGNVKTWNAETGSLESKVENVYYSAFLKFISNNLVAIKKVDSIDIYSISEKSVINRISNISYSDNTIDIDPSGKYIATGYGSSAGIWDAATGSFIKQIDDYKGNPYAIAFSTDGSFLACCFSDSLINIYNISDGSLKTSLSIESSPNKIKFVNGDRYLLALVNNKLVKCDLSVNPPTANVIQDLYLNTFDISNDGTKLAITHDLDVRLYNFPALTTMNISFQETETVNTVAFSPDNSKIAVGCGFGNIKIYNIATKNVFKTLRDDSLKETLYANCDDVQENSNCTCNTVCSCNSVCSCDTVCSCDSEGGSSCGYWYPN